MLLPVVVVDQPRDVPGVSRVCIDDRAAMRQLAEHVLELGHREIGLLTMRLGRDWPDAGPAPAVADPQRVRSPHFHVQSERIRGVRDAMTAAGLDPASLTVVESYEHLPSSGGAGADAAPDARVVMHEKPPVAPEDAPAHVHMHGGVPCTADHGEDGEHGHGHSHKHGHSHDGGKTECHEDHGHGHGHGEKKEEHGHGHGHGH